VERCEECGFEYVLDDAPGAGPAIVAGVRDLTPLLRTDRAELRARPGVDAWSPLEYGCHLRDVLLVQRERVLAARRTDRPTIDPMGRDERVAHDGYAEQDPAAVTRQLEDAALMFANVLARLGPTDWDRTLMYNYPALSERSLRWVAVHTLHEVRHHQLDVRAGLGRPAYE
jgi:hypothetical protein